MAPKWTLAEKLKNKSADKFRSAVIGEERCNGNRAVLRDGMEGKPCMGPMGVEAVVRAVVWVTEGLSTTPRRHG